MNGFDEKPKNPNSEMVPYDELVNRAKKRAKATGEPIFKPFIGDESKFLDEGEYLFSALEEEEKMYLGMLNASGVDPERLETDAAYAVEVIIPYLAGNYKEDFIFTNSGIREHWWVLLAEHVVSNYDELCTEFENRLDSISQTSSSQKFVYLELLLQLYDLAREESIGKAHELNEQGYTHEDNRELYDQLDQGLIRLKEVFRNVSDDRDQPLLIHHEATRLWMLLKDDGEDDEVVIRPPNQRPIKFSGEFWGSLDLHYPTFADVRIWWNPNATFRIAKSNAGLGNKYEVDAQESYHTCAEIEDLFDDLSIEASAEDILAYKLFVSRGLLKSLQNDFGADLSQLNIREQFHFFNFIKDILPEEVGGVQNFTKTFGLTGMRSFLALEELGPMFGWTIASGATLAAQLGLKGTIDNILKKYLELEDQTQVAEDYLKKNFDTEDQEAVHEMIKNIRKRAAHTYKELLSHSVGTSEDEAKIAELIERTNAEAVLFTSAFGTLKRSGDLDLESIKDTVFESVSALSFSKEDIERMDEILKRNWGGESEEFLAEVKQSLYTALENEKSTFYVLRHKGQIVGFNRFDDNTADENNPHIYFGSFNTDPEYGNGKLGEAIYEESLKHELKRGTHIEANCDPNSPITKKYLSSGFVATNYFDFGGKPSFHIVHFGELSEGLAGRVTPIETIIANAERGEYKTGSIVMREMKFDEPEDFREISEGKVLSKYFEQNGKTYLVFEELPEFLKDKIAANQQPD